MGIRRNEPGNEPGNLFLLGAKKLCEALVCKLLNHMGLAVIVSHFIADHLKSGRLVLIHPGDEQLENVIASFRHRRRQATVTEELFHRHLLQSLEQLPNLDLYLLALPMGGSSV